MTSGEGGIVLTNSSEVADKAWSYCNQGRRRGAAWYEHFTLGSNYRITGFQAAILRDQLKRLLGQIAIRSDNVNYFRERLRSFPGITLADDDARVDRHPYYLLTLRYDASMFGGVERDFAIKALRAEGIPVQPTYPHPLYRNPLFHSSQPPACLSGPWQTEQHYESLHLSEAERVCRDGMWLEQNLFLGTHRDVDDVLEAFEKVKECSPALLDCQQVAGTSRQ